MKKAGGIIALIAALFGTIMAFVTLAFGGVGSALGGEGAETIIGLGWAGIFLTFAIIVFAVIAMFSKSKFPGIAIIILSAITVVAGGTLVAIFMVLSLIGGILVVVGAAQEKRMEVSM
jgi:hypothetical protein